MKKTVKLLWALILSLSLIACMCMLLVSCGDDETPDGSTQSTACQHKGGTATCTAKAVCTACNKEYGEALGHAWQNADCTTAKTCTRCEATEGEALGHSWVDADCTNAKTCSVCQVTEGEANGHSWVDADCTTSKTCSVCQATEGEANGHSWVDANCTTPKTCSVCQVTEGEVGGHSWQDATCLLPKTCSVCQETEGNALNHDLKERTDLPTCTEIGKTVNYCTRCDFEEIVAGSEVDADGHKYDYESADKFIVVEEPTCTTAGVKYYTCTVCGETPSDDGNDREIPLLGHDYKENVIAPTCVLGGYTEVECSRCDLYETKDELPAAGHKYNMVDSAKEGEDYTVTVEPTCTEKGERTYICTVCHEAATEANGKSEIGALGHNMQVSQEPWCGNDGITEYACANTCRGVKCTETSTGEATQVYKHSYPDSDPQIPATCVANATYACAECGKSFVAYEGDEKGQATGAHVYDVEISVVPSTCVTKGYTVFGCSAGECGTTKNDKETDLVPHTLGEPSVFGTVSCSVCNKSYVDVTAEKVSDSDNICMGCGNDPCTCEGVSADWEGYVNPKDPEEIKANEPLTKTEVEWTDSTSPLSIGGGLIILNSADEATVYTVVIYESADSAEALYTFEVSGKAVMVDLSEYATVGKVVITATTDATVSLYSLI